MYSYMACYCSARDEQGHAQAAQLAHTRRKLASGRKTLARIR
jgi:hypothetical protein